jgi:hypothetical protein
MSTVRQRGEDGVPGRVPADVVAGLGADLVAARIEGMKILLPFDDLRTGPSVASTDVSYRLPALA